MPVTINASTSTGLVQSADTSGEIELQSNGTTALKVNTNEGIQILNCLGVGNATPSTSGAGITFPATQSASSDANTLDDYEEGTFTPTITSDSVPPSSVTYNVQTGFYTKVGRQVTAYGRIQLNTRTGGTGNVCMGGFPFPFLGASGAGSLGYISNLTFGTGYTQITFYINNANTTNLFFARSGTGTFADNVPISSVPSNLDFTYCVTYFTS